MTTTRVRANRIETSGGTRWFLDEGCWVEVSGLDGELAARLAEVDGWQPASRATAGLDDDRARRLQDLLGLLADAGLAVDQRRDAPAATLHLAVVGTGPLARAVAAALLRAGVRRLDVAEEPSRASVGEAPRRAPALVAALRPRLCATVRALSHLDDLAGRGVDLVVVATSGLVSDRVVLDRLVELDLAHLVVHAHGDTGRIGPLVLPGATPCCRCHDLAVAATDPLWPQALAALRHGHGRPDQTMTSHLAARVALEVGWLARDLGRASRLRGRVELHDATTPTVREFSFGPSPACGCGAGA